MLSCGVSGVHELRLKAAQREQSQELEKQRRPTFEEVGPAMVFRLFHASLSHEPMGTLEPV